MDIICFWEYIVAAVFIFETVQVLGYTVHLRKNPQIPKLSVLHDGESLRLKGMKVTNLIGHHCYSL